MRSLLLTLPLAFAVSLTSPAHSQASLVIFARHAEKAAPTGDPALTPVGELRAQDLARALADVKLSAVISTQFQRTRLTAAPVAKAAGLEPTIVRATGNAANDAAAILQALNALPSGSSALVVGHSNTLAPIIAALGGPTVPNLCDSEHATLFVLHRSPGQPVSMIRSRYGAAEPPEASQC
jgi:phosphohistidine phosphatase SixA